MRAITTFDSGGTASDIAPRTFRALVATSAALVLLLAVAYSVVTPAYEAPDEPAHLAFAMLVARERRLPVLGVDPVYHAVQPPLYYVAAGLLIRAAGLPAVADRPLERSDTGIALFAHGGADAFPWQGEYLTLHAVRLGSPLLAAGTVLLAAGLARQLSGSRWVGALAAMGLAGLPQFTYLSGMVNNDNLAALLGGAFLLACVRIVERPGACSWPEGAFLGTLTGLAALGKSTGAPLLAVVLLAILLRSRRHGQWLLPAVAALLAFTAVAGWWYGRNLLLYGEPTAVFTLYRLAPEHYMPPSPPDVFYLNLWPKTVFYSFWFMPGWTKLAAPMPLYRAWLGFALLAAVGLALSIGARRPRPRVSAVVLAAVGVTVGLFAFHSLSTSTGMARHLFPVQAVFATLLGMGIAGLASPLPARAQRPAAASVVALLILANLFLLVYWMPRRFAGY